MARRRVSPRFTLRIQIPHFLTLTQDTSHRFGANVAQMWRKPAQIGVKDPMWYEGGGLEGGVRVTGTRPTPLSLTPRPDHLSKPPKSGSNQTFPEPALTLT